MPRLGRRALPPGRRTAAQASRVTGLDDVPGFGRYHGVLNRARRDTRALARRLPLHVADRLLPTGPEIKARGIYRDPVRSPKGHFVKTGGLRWLSLMVIAPVPWAARHWALPLLTVLAPPERRAEGQWRTPQAPDPPGVSGHPLGLAR